MKHGECRKIRTLMPDFLDGELGDSDGRAVEEHLQTCMGCREELQSLRNLFTIVKNLDDDAAAASPSEAYWANFTPRVNRKIRDLDQGRSFGSWMPRYLYYLVPVCTVLLLAAIGVMRMHYPGSPWDAVDYVELEAAFQLAFSRLTVAELVSYMDPDALEGIEEEFLLELDEDDIVAHLESTYQGRDTVIPEMELSPALDEVERGDIIDNLDISRDMQRVIYESILSLEEQERIYLFRELEKSTILAPAPTPASGV